MNFLVYINITASQAKSQPFSNLLSNFIIMSNTQILATICKMMEFNNISINDLIEFYDKECESVTINEEELNETNCDKKQPEDEKLQENSKKFEKQPENETKKLKWGDEAVELDDDLNESKDNSWSVVVKKTSNTAIKQSKPTTEKKQKPVEVDNREEIYTVKEFIQCIKNKKKLHVDFKIHPSAHCPHTFSGTICKNVKECGLIHIQRCVHDMDCKHKYCQFLHGSDMPDDDAYYNYMDTMELYNNIKKNKQVRA